MKKLKLLPPVAGLLPLLIVAAKVAAERESKNNQPPCNPEDAKDQKPEEEKPESNQEVTDEKKKDTPIEITAEAVSLSALLREAAKSLEEGKLSVDTVCKSLHATFELRANMKAVAKDFLSWLGAEDEDKLDDAVDEASEEAEEEEAEQESADEESPAGCICPGCLRKFLDFAADKGYITQMQADALFALAFKNQS